jgi:hypothetical protein
MSLRNKEHWGQYLWGFIHSITIIDSENNEINNIKMNNIKVKYILKELIKCIPCDKCKDTYKKHLYLLESLDLTKNMVLFYWSVDLHNEVNRKLNKPELSYEMALLKWSKKVDATQS